MSCNVKMDIALATITKQTNQQCSNEKQNEANKKSTKSVLFDIPFII